MDSGCCTQQHRGVTRRLHTGGSSCRVDAKQLGHSDVHFLHQLGTSDHVVLVEEHFRIVHPAGDGNADEGFPCDDLLGGLAQVAEVGVTSLQGPQNGASNAGISEAGPIVAVAAIDLGQVAHLEATTAIFSAWKHADLDTGVVGEIQVIGEDEAWFTIVTHRFHDACPLITGQFVTLEDDRVVRATTLRIGVEPVASLGVEHLLVILAEQADGRTATNTTREHSISHEHSHVVGNDRGDPVAGLDMAVQQSFELAQGSTQAIRTRCLEATTDVRTLGADFTEVEGYVAALVLREHGIAFQIAGEQYTERISPAFDTVRDQEDLGLVCFTRGDVGQLGDVLLLHREAYATATEQQVHGFLEELRTIHMAGAAVVQTGFVLEELFATELKSTLSTQYGFLLVHVLSKLDHLFQFRRHDVSVLLTVHVHYSCYGFLPGFIAILIVLPAGVSQVELGLAEHLTAQVFLRQRSAVGHTSSYSWC